MVKKIQIDFLIKTDFKQEINITALLNQFERETLFCPESWNRNDWERQRTYIKESAIKEIIQHGEEYLPTFYGSHACPYEFIIHLNSNPINPERQWLNTASFMLRNPSNEVVIEEVFRFSTILANVLQPELATLEIIDSEVMEDSDWAFGIVSPDVQKYGLAGLSHRTWFGSYIFSLLGKEILEKTDGILRETAWGGCEFDLVEKPWLHDFSIVLKKQKAIMNILKTSGMFGNYSKYPLPLYEAAPNWQPIPLNAT